MGLAGGELDAGSACGFALVADVLAAELETTRLAFAFAFASGSCALLDVGGDVTDVEVGIFGDILLVHGAEVDDEFLLFRLEDQKSDLDVLNRFDDGVTSRPIGNPVDVEKIEEGDVGSDQGTISGVEMPIRLDAENRAHVLFSCYFLHLIGERLKNLLPAILGSAREKAIGGDLRALLEGSIGAVVVVVVVVIARVVSVIIIIIISIEVVFSSSGRRCDSRTGVLIVVLRIIVIILIAI